MSALDIKLFRDVRRLWAQVLAIALVIGGGVATLILAVGSHRSLDETRIAYYERYSLRRRLRAGQARTEGACGPDRAKSRASPRSMRASPSSHCSICPDFPSPLAAQFISLPDTGEPMLNRLYMRSGRLPEPGRADEVVVNESFAKAHGFAPGAGFSAILNGRKRELVIVGTALSPEFIYTVGPGDIMPDDRRFGIVWMSEKALASAYDLDGAFSSVSVKLQRGASEREVIARLDSLLDRLWRAGSLRPQGPDLARLARPRARHAQQHEPHAAADLPSGRRHFWSISRSAGWSRSNASRSGC